MPAAWSSPPTAALRMRRGRRRRNTGSFSSRELIDNWDVGGCAAPVATTTRSPAYSCLSRAQSRSTGRRADREPSIGCRAKRCSTTRWRRCRSALRGRQSTRSSRSRLAASDRRAPEHPSPSGRRSRPMSRAPRPCISPAALPAPEPFLVFFPTADGEPIDNWDLAGLRGTGSHDYAVSGLFAISPRLVVCRTNSRISSYSSACVSRRGSSGIQSLRKFIEPKAYKNT